MNTPLVSIGLPVFNGEGYVRHVLDSILHQTFSNFELIITDNASTDGTEQICRLYASGDSRIRYIRNSNNIGGPANFNRAFELSRGTYFKWVAHDDMYEASFVQRCVEVLDKDPTIVLCYSKTRLIDEHGKVLGSYVDRVRTDSPSVRERFSNMIGVKHSCFQMFGVMRSGDLRKTSLLKPYFASDLWLLAQLSLMGRVYEIPEYLYLRRGHPNSSWDPVDPSRWKWWNPDAIKKRNYPTLRKFLEYIKAVSRSPLSQWERVLCIQEIGRWAVKGLGRKMIRGWQREFEQDQMFIPEHHKDSSFVTGRSVGRTGDRWQQQFEELR